MTVNSSELDIEQCCVRRSLLQCTVSRTIPTTSWTDSPPLRIAPTLRSAGRVARAGRTPRLIDNRAELAELREQSRREAEELRLAQQQLLTPAPRRLSELEPLAAAAFPLFLDLQGEVGTAGDTALHWLANAETWRHTNMADGDFRSPPVAGRITNDSVCSPTDLARQMADEVRHREVLITDRERELFEQRLIGDIAQALHYPPASTAAFRLLFRATSDTFSLRPGGGGVCQTGHRSPRMFVCTVVFYRRNGTNQTAWCARRLSICTASASTGRLVWYAGRCHR